MTDSDTTDIIRCAFCRQPCPVEPVSAEYDGEHYEFCSNTCYTAMRDSQQVFTEERSHHRFIADIAGLDASLPQGMPRNSFVILVGHPGTREEAIQAEFVWRTLERGEPALAVGFTEPPTSVVENFLAMGWNVLPYLENGRLQLLDCFTHRLDDRSRLYDRMTDWNNHLRRFADPQTIAVRDPSDPYELRNSIDNALESAEMVERGIVVIDSLVEFGSLVQPVQAYSFVKGVRSEVCKGRFVPVIAGGTVDEDNSSFPADLGYVVDGIVDISLDGSIVEDTLFRRLRVRKMRGVLAISEWHTYEYTSGLGMVTFDPTEEASTEQPTDTDSNANDEDETAAESGGQSDQ